MYISFIVLCVLQHFLVDSSTNPDIEALAEEQLNAYCSLHHANLPCATRCQPRSLQNENIADKYLTPMTNQTREYIVELANKVRTIIAEGKGRAQFPPASNMRVISYDKECEFLAACFLKLSVYTDKYVKISLDGNHLGGTGYGIVSFNKTVDRIGTNELQDAFMGWYQTSFGPTKSLTYNKDTYTEAVLKDTQPDFANDFLQLGAANTSKIGCAKYVKLLNSNLMFYEFYCVYNPAVRLGKDFIMYKPGSPTSFCLEWGEEPNEEYPVLCGNIRDLSEDQFVGYQYPSGAWTFKFNPVWSVLVFILTN